MVQLKSRPTEAPTFCAFPNGYPVHGNENKIICALPSSCALLQMWVTRLQLDGEHVLQHTFMVLLSIHLLHAPQDFNVNVAQYLTRRIPVNQLDSARAQFRKDATAKLDLSGICSILLGAITISVVLMLKSGRLVHV